MRYPDGHKQAVRQKIVEAASRALRREGLAGVSIPALMKRAGLTHGGFYVHFCDRDELVAEAARFAGDETGARVFDGTGSVEEMLEAYLSPQHVAHPEAGCVVAALGGEGARQPTRVRRAFDEVARGLVVLVQRKLTPRRDRERAPSDEALALTARMVGAVVLARMVDDPKLAARILAAAKAEARVSLGGDD